jgi:chaperonin GroEL
MDERPRIFKSGAEAREVILNAVNKIADIVKSTLGPSGRNVLIDRGYRKPRITNDGVFIAKSLDLKDPLEQVVATQLVEVADQTNKDAGDGTTTSLVIAQKIIQDGLKKIGAGGTLAGTTENVMDIKRSIDASLEKAIKNLDKQKRKATDRETLINVATTSLEDREMSEIIADMVLKIGDDGYINVLEGFHGEIETEVITGMQFDGTYAHEFMATNDSKKAEYDDIAIVLTNHHIEAPSDIAPFTRAWFEKGKKEIAIFAPKFSLETITDIAKAKSQGVNILAVKIPALTDNQIDDVAAYTGAWFCNKEKGNQLSEITPEQFGNLSKIIVDDDKVIAIGGNKMAAQERIKSLKAEMKVEKDEMFRLKLDTRIASLASSVGVIKVGSSTEAQKGYMKLKLEDAVFATQHALKEGVVEGGGIALKKCAESLGKDDILYTALFAPYNQIRENAGGSIKVSKDIIDPVKVTKSALRNACYVSGMLLTTDTVVAIDRLKEQADAILEVAEVLKHE